MAKQDLPKEVAEALAQLNNKVDAMNKYYAKTVTVVNDQLELIKNTHDKIDAIWKATAQTPIEKAIELGGKTPKVKATKKKK